VEGPKKAEPKKEEPKKEEPKKEEKRPAAPRFPLPDIDEMLKQLPPDVPPEQVKEMRKRMLEMRKRMEEAMKRLERNGGAFPNLPGGVMPLFPQLPGGGIGRIPNFPAFPAMPAFPNMPGRPFGGGMPEPRLGARLEPPSETLVDQLELPQGQGLVVSDVAPTSAAGKGGVKAHDILLEVAGKAVPSRPDEFQRQLATIKADSKVDVVVMRKGRRETLKGVALPEAKEAPGFPGRPGLFPNFPNVFPPAGGFGAGGLGARMSFRRNGNEFTITRTEGGSEVSVSGELDGGKAKVKEVRITEDGKATTYPSLDRVPAAQKDKVKGLIDMAEQGRRLPLRPARPRVPREI
jgi:hypothetical protein